MTVYFIAAGHGMTSDMVKIGFTTGCPHARLKALQTGSPILLDLIHHEPGYGVEYERALHEYFAEDWQHGEWFEFTRAIWSLIHALQAGRRLHELIDPRDYPDGLRCDTCMNIGGICEGVKEANFRYGAGL